MKIVFHSNKILPVKTYGGIERIVFWHMCELVRQGHKVVLIGHPASQISEYGIELIPYEASDLGWEELIPSNTDIVHLPYNYQVKSGVPTLCTMHGNAQLGEKLSRNTVFVSKRHAQIHGSQTYVHNALDFNEYPYEKRKKRWNNFLFLAKASWRVKNLRDCLRACKRSQKSLEIIGGKTILPRRRITSHGFLGGQEKLNIMNNCDALLFPVRWEEPFGIAMIEAMALGLPVIGSKYGSLPEVISQESGIICGSFEELVEALSEPPKRDFNSDEIRSYAQSKFSIQEHSNAYIELYKKVIAKENLNEDKPALTSHKRAETLLPF